MANLLPFDLKNATPFIPALRNVHISVDLYAFLFCKLRSLCRMDR